ncbi:MAG: ShlB/FhaC/HecB family hemolysin secretion/activation protein [Burkholderiales bacterium]|nr:ShlB/FhaC/HecB family hemolysin secretion/activation protein [Burkholderiales bacterium]
MRRAVVMTFLAVAAAPSAGQVDPGQRLLEELQQRQLEREERRPPGTIELKPEARPAPAPEDAVCFDIDRIELEGATLVDADARDALLARYTGKCLGRAEINALLAALTGAYVERGFVTTRVYIPPQNLSSRVLKLLVIEGRIERLYMNQDADADRRRAWAAFPSGPGDPLRLQDLEQGLEQLNRVPSARATVRLQPGTAPGGTVVAVEDRSEDRFRGFLGYDNYGQRRTGRQRFNLGIEADNVLALNDTWAIVYAGSLDTNAVAGTGSVGLGNWTVGVLASYSESLDRLTADVELFARNTVAGVLVERLLARTATAKASVAFLLDRKWSRRYVNDVELIPQDLTVARLGPRAQVRYAQGLLFLDGALSAGLTALGATRDPEPLPPDAPVAQFAKFEAGATWLGRLESATLRASIRGQYSLDPLYGSEQIVLGGANSVRGFAEAIAFGDSGWFTRNELVLILRQGALELAGADWSRTVQPYVFLDGGQVFLRTGRFDRALAGAGAGLRFARRPLSFDVTLAYPFLRNDLPTQAFSFRVALQLW